MKCSPVYIWCRISNWVGWHHYDKWQISLRHQNLGLTTADVILAKLCMSRAYDRTLSPWWHLAWHCMCTMPEWSLHTRRSPHVRIFNHHWMFHNGDHLDGKLRLRQCFCGPTKVRLLSSALAGSEVSSVRHGIALISFNIVWATKYHLPGAVLANAEDPYKSPFTQLLIRSFKKN